jgi:hypothetical protein
VQRFISERAWDVSHIVSVKVSKVREVTSVCKERAKSSHQLCLRPNSIKGLSIRLLNPTSPSALKRASLPHPSTATDRMLQQIPNSLNGFPVTETEGSSQSSQNPFWGHSTSYTDSWFLLSPSSYAQACKVDFSRNFYAGNFDWISSFCPLPCFILIYFPITHGVNRTTFSVKRQLPQSVRCKVFISPNDRCYSQ